MKTTDIAAGQRIYAYAHDIMNRGNRRMTGEWNSAMPSNIRCAFSIWTSGFSLGVILVIMVGCSPLFGATAVEALNQAVSKLDPPTSMPWKTRLEYASKLIVAIASAKHAATAQDSDVIANAQAVLDKAIAQSSRDISIEILKSTNQTTTALQYLQSIAPLVAPLAIVAKTAENIDQVDAPATTATPAAVSATPFSDFTPTKLFDIIVEQAQKDAPYVVQQLLNRINATLTRLIGANPIPARASIGPFAELFPTLATNLIDTGNSPPAMANRIRSAAETDLRMLPKNLLQVVADRRWIGDDEVLALPVLATVFQQIIKGKNAIAALMPLKDLPDATDPSNPGLVHDPQLLPIFKALKTIGLVAEMERQIETTPLPTARQQLRFISAQSLMQNAAISPVLAALFAKATGFSLPVGGSDDDLLASLHTANGTPILNEIGMIIADIDQFREKARTLSAAALQSKDQTQIVLLSRQFLRAFEVILVHAEDISAMQIPSVKPADMTIQQFAENNARLIAKAHTFIDSYVIPIADMHDAILARDYTSMASRLIALARQLINAKYPGFELTSSPGEKDLTDASTFLMETSNDNDSTKKLRMALAFRELDYLLGIAAPIAAATDDASLDKAIVGALSPAGAYRLKRNEHAFHLFINSYLGITGGAERPEGVAQSWNAYSGISVPVGIEATWGDRRCCLCPSREFGLLLAPIDLGSIAQVRYRSDYQQDKFTWRDVFTPGAYIIMGFSRSYPLTVGLGARYIPTLRNIVSGSEGNHSVQFGLFIGWDVPLVNLLPDR